MKARSVMAAMVAASIGIGSYAYADTMTGKTRAQVRQELIEAQQSGWRHVTDASYPAISPMHAGRIEKQAADTQAASANEPAPRAISSGRAQPAAQQPACQGPVSFCNIYFGS
ncbi:DUF4148 domain-containing protein [Trinickia sp.]|uniref:DUF4148 domain-containing protein n=1 Tax=Trinickia sp. TaxID=2571163 RepID=UPI003F7DB281